MMMKCPTCGAATLVHDTRDVPYIYKGESTTLPQVTGDFCTACDEFILNAAVAAEEKGYRVSTQEAKGDLIQ